MDPLDRLRAFISVAPPHTMVPVEALRDVLEAGGSAPEPAELVADLTVPEVARLVGRHPATVRAWVRTGVLAAYQMRGREYRVTRAALTDFFERERRGAGPSAPPSASPTSPADLGAWRSVRGLSRRTARLRQTP